MGTKNNPGAYDCYANADPDEPMFVLLARDKHAPTLVWLWSVLREIDGEDKTKVEEAKECANAMLLWQRAHDRKTIGLGAATLAGVFELIRAANHSAKNAVGNVPTDSEAVRLYLSNTEFEPLDHVEKAD